MFPEISDADRSFLAAVTRFVDDEVVGTVHDRDSNGEYPADLVPRLRQLGMFSASTRDLRTYALALEELARGWVSLTPIVNAHSTSVWTTKNYGTRQQQEDLLPQLLAGDRVAALALTEPGGGTDLAALSSSAVQVEAGWRIRAHKALITHGSNATSLLVLVRTDPDPAAKHRGLSLFLLNPGEWEVVRALPKLGTRGIETVELTVNDVLVPPDRLIGETPGQGFRQVMDALEVGRIAVASAAVGAGRSSLWYAIDYAKRRRVSGQLLIDMPVIRAKLADAANRISAAKALTQAAAAAKNAGGRHDVEASAAKMLAGDAAVNAAMVGMEIGGGWAYVEEYEFSRHLRDAGLFIAGEGANGVLGALVGNALARGTSSLDWI